MRFHFTLLSLVLSTISFSQPSKYITYKNIPGLSVVDSISSNDIAGDFCNSNGFWGYGYQLDSNMLCKQYSFGCYGKEGEVQGSWTINKGNSIVIEINKQAHYFNIIKFDRFYFLLRPSQMEKFIVELQSEQIKYKNVRGYNLGGKICSRDCIIGYGLVRKYFARDLEYGMD